MQHRWFGREPALIIQAVGAVLTLLVAFQLPHLTVATAAYITAALTALASTITGLYVRPWQPSVFGGLIGATATLLAAFGWHFSQQQVGSFTVLVALLMALVTRAQQTPSDSPQPVGT